MNDFLIEIADILEVDQVQNDTKYKDLETWDSLAALSLLTYIADEFSVNLDENDLVSANTLEDLHSLVLNKKG